MVVLALYFLSGAAGLIFETVFLRQATWLFGSATVATTLVLCAFMGGLAAGAALLGPAADRTARPLRLYGWLEIGTGLAGAIAAWLLGSGRESLMAPLRWVGPGQTERILAFAISLALLLVPTAAMGGTLPVLGRYLSREPGRLLRPLGLLYGLNTLGGVLGVLVTGFLLFEFVGVSRSAYLAVALDVGVGLGAILLDRAYAARDRVEVSPRPTGTAAQPGRPRAAAEPPIEGARGTMTASCLAAAGIGGFAVLGYEVVWTRLLSLPMRSYAYSFSLMLSLFLAGLVAGSLVVASLGPRITRPARLLAWAEIGMGLYVATSLLWLPRLLAPTGASGLGPFLAWSALKAACVILPPTILSGMALPLAVRAVSGDRVRVGRGIGGVYAINTSGAIAGALGAGLVFLPALGAPRTLALLAALNAAAGAVVMVAAERGRVQRLAAPAVTLACALAILLPPQRFLEGFLDASRGKERISRVLFFREGATDTIAVVKKDYGFFDPEAKSLITNGVAMSATVKPVWRYMAMEGHLPVLLAGHPSRALVICLGTGITLGAIVSHPELKTIDAVELSEGVLEGLPQFSLENRRAFEDPRVRLVREDGRHFLEMSREPYDVITLEPPPPIVAGSVHLYTLDFYRLCRERLRPGGVLAQWLPLHAQSLASARMEARTFLAAFPYAQLWLPSIRDAVLIGSDSPLRLDLARLRGAYAQATTAANLREAVVETPEAFLATFLLDRAGTSTWAGDAPVITDERPLMEFFRGRGPTMRDREIGTLASLPQGAWEFVSGLDEDRGLRARLDVESRAHRLYLRSEIDEDGAAGLEAARLSAGTEFFRYRLGCAARQRDFIDRQLGEFPEWRQQIARCDALFPSGRTADDAAGRGAPGAGLASPPRPAGRR